MPSKVVRRNGCRYIKGDEYRPPDIENSIQLLQVIRTGVATYGRVRLTVWPASVKTSYWTISTPDLSHTVRPWHMRLLVKRGLVDFYDISPGEFLGQDALGTLVGDVVIGIKDDSQFELSM